MADETPSPDEPIDRSLPSDDPEAAADLPPTRPDQPDEPPTQELDDTAVQSAAGVPGADAPAAASADAGDAPAASADAGDAPGLAPPGGGDAPPPPTSDASAAPPPPPPPPGAATSGSGAARRYVGIGIGVLALVAASLAGYGVGRSSDDEAVSFEDEDQDDRGDRSDDDRPPDERRRLPDDEDGDWDDDERRGPGIPDLDDLPHGIPELPDGRDGRMPEVVVPGGRLDGTPVFGTVSEVGDDSFVVETPGGDSVTVTVTDDTDYMEVGEEGDQDGASLPDLEEGDEVVAWVSDDGDNDDDESDEGDDDTVQADEVIFGDLMTISGPGSRRG